MPLLVVLLSSFGGGCATIRVTDPARTATEQFLMSVATSRAIDQLSADALRDREIFIDSSYLSASSQTSAENLFALGELRAKLLLEGVRLVSKREEAKIIMEVRSGGIGIDRFEYLLGIPAIYIPGAAGGAPIATPELALVKSTRQKGFAGITYVAYWAESGEILSISGPFVGRTSREDWWFFGIGPRTLGDIPTVRAKD